MYRVSELSLDPAVLGPKPKRKMDDADKERLQNLKNAMDILFKLLNVLGLTVNNKNPQKTGFKALSLRNWLLLIACHVYLMHSLCSAAMRVFTSDLKIYNFAIGTFIIQWLFSPMTSFMNLAFGELAACGQKIFKILISTLIVDHHFIRHGRLIDLMMSTREYILRLEDDGIAKIARRCRFLAINAWVFLVFCFETLPHALTNSESYLATEFYGLNCSVSMSRGAALTLVTFNFCMVTILESLTVVLLFLFLCVCSHVIAASRYYEVLRTMSGVLHLEDVDRVRMFHETLHDLITNTDQLYRDAVLGWFLDIAQRYFLALPQAFDALKTDGAGANIGLLFSMAYCGYLFVLLTTTTADIHEIVDNGKQLVDDISPNVEPKDWEAQAVLVSLMTTMSRARLYITAWDFFVLDRGMLLQGMSITITYSVLVVQFMVGH